ncbi:MAG: sugar-binding protein [Selenomonadaceae bacterium]|nr:sugar-binding protein [Selenomonadaceae bacterium]
MNCRNILAVCLSLILIVFVTGCFLTDRRSTKIGVAMPTQTRQRWNQDGANIERKLLERGYSVELEFGNNEIDLQVSQIDKMIEDGCKVIIIGAVDANSLSEVLDKAKNNGIKIISYDRLIMNTDAIDYYATFDNLAVGTIQGEYIEDKLGLKVGRGPYNLEIIAGSLDDNNTIFFFEGAMEVLRPYIQSKQLVVQSRQVNLKQCAIPHWKEHIAKERMLNILNTYYIDKYLDVALCANDSVAIGVMGALEDKGYYDTDDEKVPIITGQDCDRKNMNMIINAEQTMSIFKDTRLLAEQVVKMVDAIVAGKEPETNDIGNYNNGVKFVPSFLVRPQFVDKDNYREVLIDSGYYNEAEFQNP